MEATNKSILNTIVTIHYFQGINVMFLWFSLWKTKLISETLGEPQNVYQIHTDENIRTGKGNIKLI
jgi:hypothetical protein